MHEKQKCLLRGDILFFRFVFELIALSLIMWNKGIKGHNSSTILLCFTTTVA